MLELNASSFLSAATNLTRLHQIFNSITSTHPEPLLEISAAAIRPHAEDFKDEAEKLGARLSVVAAERLLIELNRTPCRITVGQAVRGLEDIESRFADYLEELQFFVLSSQEAIFLQPADQLMESAGFSAAFPDASFEIEEAAKCFALGRHTAAVFHSMRVLEIGIRALAKRLGIDDPTKPSERNWSFILQAIQSKIDELWPRSRRMPNSEGAVFEELYANLEAVRNPWRNATMHVENIYALHEALHIIRCCAFFLQKLAKVSDEWGNPPDDPTIPELLEGGDG